jgi:hypothetical protein
MYRYLFFLFAILFGASCRDRQPSPAKPRRDNAITSIVFASGGCNVMCPLFAMEIDSDFHVAFYGAQHAPKTGFFGGKISPDLWDSLNLQFERIHFGRLDSAYDHSQDDLAVTTTVWYGTRKKTVLGQLHDLPDSVQKAVNSAGYFRYLSWVA